MSDHPHRYALQLAWEGNLGSGTTHYEKYGRQYRVRIDGKPDLVGSADRTFRGDPKLHNPEEMLVAALSSCHLLSFLAVCAKERVNVLAYEDAATGTMELDGRGGGKLTEVTLRPRVTVAEEKELAALERLHTRANQLCFIASSVNFPVQHEATAVVGKASS